MPDRHALRREKLRRTLAEDDAAGILVSSAVNVSYLTGFTGDSTALLVLRDRDLLVSDARYDQQLGEECPDLERTIRPVSRKLWEAVALAIGGLGASRMLFEAGGVLVSDHHTLRDALPTVAAHGVTGRVEALRAVKDDEEIATIRRAIASAERAFAMLRAGLRPEESEIDAADMLDHYLRRCGARHSAFDPIVAVGERSALPHARPSPGVKIGDAPFVLVDWGGVVDGYRSDLTRMLAPGKVGGEFEAVYEAVLRAQARAIAAIRPGAIAGDVDAQARAAVEEAGYAGLFTHGTGHGLGREVHERPWIRPLSDEVLRPGMIFTVEPGIYRPGWGGIRIEDDVLVTPDGCEVLTSVPKALDTLSPH